MMIEKNKTAFHSPGFKPRQGLVAEPTGQVEPADFSALGIEIQMAAFQVPHLDLQQLADSGACRPEKADYKIPVIVIVLFQAPF